MCLYFVVWSYLEDCGCGYDDSVDLCVYIVVFSYFWLSLYGDCGIGGGNGDGGRGGGDVVDDLIW